MPNKTQIEWADYSSNPVAPKGGGWGCNKVSPGCDFCYAERLNKWRGNGRAFEGEWEFILKEKELQDIRKMEGGVSIFMGDMTDLFHSAIPWRFLLEIFKVVYDRPDITFLFLTKRPGRMAYFFKYIWEPYTMEANLASHTWPPNAWAGVSVELEKYLPRLDVLHRVPAAVRFASLEPLLGPLHGPLRLQPYLAGILGQGAQQVLQWVIVGGESGSKKTARTMDPAWVRGIRDDCLATGTPFFFKQWGNWLPTDQRDVHEGFVIPMEPGLDWAWMPKEQAGHYLDNRVYHQIPGRA